MSLAQAAIALVFLLFCWWLKKGRQETARLFAMVWGWLESHEERRRRWPGL